jgi:Domain of unknown function (DUF1877)
MGITLHLKQISVSTLTILQQDPKQVELFRSAEFLAESPFWQKRKWADSSADDTKQWSDSKLGSSPYRDQFVAEWEIPDLDLHKSFPELTYLLAGFIPYTYQGIFALPELKSRPDLMQEETFMDFFIIESSAWDGLPLVNAIWAGTKIGEEGGSWYQTPEEVKQLLKGLRRLSRKGFRTRYYREAKSDEPCPWFDWDEEDEVDGLTDNYNEMVKYYRDASKRNHAMLSYLS